MCRRCRAQFDFHLGFQVVCNRDTGFKFISGRDQHRHARRDHKRSANQGFALGRAGGVIRNRNRHDLERAVKKIRHIANDFTRGWICLENTRPKHHRLFCDALERIKPLNVAAAAEGRDRAEQGKFWNDQIDDLRGLDLERALAKEEPDRVRCFKIGDLQNSFIDREENDLAGAICLVGNVKRFSRLDRGRRLQIKRQLAFFDVGGEMDDAVTERTN